ncbi:hypothetical protein GCM10007913_14230 [Devosia yakushimensis]|uniref:BrnT family toxin n=1 Tax=Devosia yakushimensis TaxID=470028 RepID=A0ABQ5UFZ6_9HYPH|nr:BrnT family toxin [Devosia yakushimensis]GLQ09491.1 hypothetical protein GCM10007913_14230 [Devosia yakushimensis]
MRIVWDEPKRRANIAKHGMDFAELTTAFFEEAIIVPGKSGRKVAIGWFDGAGIVVIHVIYGTEAISVISMRAASPRERRLL